MEGYTETEMCVQCKGECCLRQPGHCLPSEFTSKEAVRAAVGSGRYAIILLLDENTRARIIRPQYKDREHKTGCTFHQENGCELKPEDRPYGCRMLKPRVQNGGHCEPQGISIEEAAKMWEESGYLPPLWKSMNQV